MSETFSSIHAYHKDYLFYRRYRRIVIKILLISNIYSLLNFSLLKKYITSIVFLNVNNTFI